MLMAKESERALWGRSPTGKVVGGQIWRGNDLRFRVVFVCNVDILCSLALGGLAEGERGKLLVLLFSNLEMCQMFLSSSCARLAFVLHSKFTIN